MSLFKKVTGKMAEYAAKQAADKAKKTALETKKRIERAIFGDEAEPAETKESSSAKPADDGGELGRYAARTRREEAEARAAAAAAKQKAKEERRQEKKTEQEVEDELAAMKQRLKDGK